MTRGSGSETTAPIRWTPAQAGYDRYATVVTTTNPDCPECPGLPVHFVPTRHGTLARTWIGDCVEIALLRPCNTGATYQGTVQGVDGGWVALDPDGVQVTGVCRNYIDAEAPLLRLKTRRRSHANLPWTHSF